MMEVICEIIPGLTLNGVVASEFYHPVSNLVRCKDCKHGTRMETSDGKFEVYCSNEMILPGFVQPDWYCADGERK